MAKLGNPNAFDAAIIPAAREFGVPAAFLRATALRESNMNPNAAPAPTPGNPKPSALGLFQVLSGTREMFNRETGATYTQPDMADPVKAARVGAWLVQRIARNLATHAPLAFPVLSWRDPRFVGLVSLSYTAGTEKTQGVPELARRMTANGIPSQSITPAAVAQVAQVAFPQSRIHVDPAKAAKGTGKGPMLSDPKTLAYVGNVAETYFKDPDVSAPVQASPAPIPAPGPRQPIQGRDTGPHLSAFAVGGILAAAIGAGVVLYNVGKSA